MKNSRIPLPVTAIFIAALFLATGPAGIAAVPLPPSHAVVMITLGPARPAAAAPVSPDLLPALDPNPARWVDIKDCTSDMRIAFFAGLKRLEMKVSVEIAGLIAVRAGMTNKAPFTNWDLALQEMNGAQLQLKTTGELLTKATPQTWEFQKAKVGQAWARTQDAYGKVKECPTD